MNYFKIFLVWMYHGLLDSYVKLFPNDRLNILISFAYSPGEISVIEDRRDKIGMLTLDAGTYTLFKNKDSAPHVTEENYLRYTQLHKDKFDIIFSYDEDFSTDGFATNFPIQLHLEGAGVPVTPVVHNIENDEIEKYMRRGHDFISLGSAQIKKPDDIDIVFKKLIGTTMMVHMLGKTETKFLVRRPLRSADSSTWGMAASVGIVLFWNDARQADEYGDKTDQIYMGDRDQCDKGKHRGVHIDDYEYREEFEEYLKNHFDLTRDDLISNNGNFNKQLVNMKYFNILEREINRIYRGKGWIDDDGKLLPIEI